MNDFCRVIKDELYFYAWIRIMFFYEVVIQIFNQIDLKYITRFYYNFKKLKKIYFFIFAYTYLKCISQILCDLSISLMKNGYNNVEQKKKF